MVQTLFRVLVRTLYWHLWLSFLRFNFHTSFFGVNTTNKCCYFHASVVQQKFQNYCSSYYTVGWDNGMMLVRVSIDILRIGSSLLCEYRHHHHHHCQHCRENHVFWIVGWKVWFSHGNDLKTLPIWINQNHRTTKYRNKRVLSNSITPTHKW